MTDRQQMGLSLLAASVANGTVVVGPTAEFLDAVNTHRAAIKHVLGGMQDWVPVSAEPVPDGASVVAPFKGIVWVAASPTPGWTRGWNEGTAGQWWVWTLTGAKGTLIADPVTYWMAIGNP